MKKVTKRLVAKKRQGARSASVKKVARPASIDKVPKRRKAASREPQADDWRILKRERDKALAENARLLDQLNARNRDLAQSLDRQTAMAEVLRIVSSSPGDLMPVFASVLANATQLCGAEFGMLASYDNGRFAGRAVYGVPMEFANALTRTRAPPASALGRLESTRETVQVMDITLDSGFSDVLANFNPILRAMRTLLAVPMLKADVLIGAIVIYRKEVRSFSDKEVALVANFAKQAVIAIENARLLLELRESLDRQTATAEVLGVINSSPGDLAPAFDAMLERAMRLCEAAFGILRTYDGQRFNSAAARGVPPRFAEFLASNPQDPQPGTIGFQILQTKAAVHVVDAMDRESYRSGDIHARALFDLGGARTSLVVPL